MSEANRTILKEIERKFMDVGYDSDDVFANNPSSLMLAKVKVVRKFEQIDIPIPQLKPEPEKCAK